MNAYVTVAVSTLGAVYIAWMSYRIARRDPRPTFNIEGNRVVFVAGSGRSSPRDPLRRGAS